MFLCTVYTYGQWWPWLNVAWSKNGLWTSCVTRIRPFCKRTCMCWMHVSYKSLHTTEEERETIFVRYRSEWHWESAEIKRNINIEYFQYRSSKWYFKGTRPSFNQFSHILIERYKTPRRKFRIGIHSELFQNISKSVCGPMQIEPIRKKFSISMVENRLKINLTQFETNLQSESGYIRIEVSDYK